jgi:hypothetical protein
MMGELHISNSITNCGDTSHSRARHTLTKSDGELLIFAVELRIPIRNKSDGELDIPNHCGEIHHHIF